MTAKGFTIQGSIFIAGMLKFTQDLKKVDAEAHNLAVKISNLAKAATKTGLVMSAAFTAPLVMAGKRILDLASGAEQAADRLLDLHQVTGLSTDSIQEFEHVARTAGVSSDGFLNVIQKLNAAMPQISEGVGKQANALDQLGISVTNTDGSLPLHE